MPKDLSERNKRLLLEATEKAVAMMEEGIHPTEAVVKAAEALRLPPTLVPRVVHACNQGMATLQREGSDSVLDKLAAFPLANLQEVMARLYPKIPPGETGIRKKAAVSADYRRPPNSFCSLQGTRGVWNEKKGEHAAKRREPWLERLAGDGH